MVRTLSSFGFLLALLCLFSPRSQAADTLPDKLSDDAFWKLIAALSEPGGTFQSENLLSNETDFPRIMAALKRTAAPGRAYLGVGPEQNFNYIAALRPKIVFIIDIRRQNMLEHLIYKALFEMSPDRASFMSRLFSRKQPPGLEPGLSAAELFDAYSELPADKSLFDKNLKDIESLLIQAHSFALTREDWDHLANVYAAFRDFGPLIDYNSRGGGPSGRAFSPSYATLMTETDRAGKEWSYLANEENYRSIRDLEIRNLIVPLTGDFGGSSAIRAVGRYLKDHDAVVSAFYLSNVEGYLFQGGDRRGNRNGGAARFYDNAAVLPLDKTSTFIRWIPGRQDSDTSISLAPILTTIDDFNAGRFTAADLFRARSFGRPRGVLGGFLNNGGRVPFGVAPVEGPAWAQWAWKGLPGCAAIVAFFLRYQIWRGKKAREGVAETRILLRCFAWFLATFIGAMVLVEVIRPAVFG